MFASLVLATYGRFEEIERLLETLASQTERDFEVIVVDQNPDDRLSTVVNAGQKAGLAIQWVKLARPNLSEARNYGIHLAKGDVIAFPDDDCWYEIETLARVRAVFDEENAPDGIVVRWAEQYDVHGGSGENVLTEGAWRNFRGGDASSITLFFRRDVFARIGVFDPRFGVGCWYGASEETDLILRALKEGMRLERCESAVVHHRFGITQGGTPALMRDVARRRARGTGGLYAKHRLGFKVVARGIVGPFLRPLLGVAPDLDFRLGIMVSMGRIEGFVSWHWTNEK